MSCTTFKTLQINFTPPSIQPSNGYFIQWRPVGESTWNIVQQNQTPILISNVPDCVPIEGMIQADCGQGNMGQPFFFVTPTPTNAS